MMIRKHSKSLIGLLAATLLFSNATSVFAADAETSTATVIETVTDGDTDFIDDEFLSVSGNMASYEVAQMSLDAESDYEVELIDDTVTDTEYLTVTIPASLELVTNDEGNYSAADVVSVNGNIGSNKLLQISTNTEITYTHTDDTNIKATGIVTFGTDGVEEYTSADSRPINVAVSRDDINYIGTYGSTVYFDISLVNNGILDVYEMDDVMLATYFTWDMTDTEANVTGLTEWGKTQKDFIIPATYEGRTVTYVAENAFKGCTNIESMKIADSVTNIKQYAFSGCTNLTSLKIPAGATYNTSGCFEGCTNIKEVTITKGTGKIQNFVSSGYYVNPWYISKDTIETIIVEDGVENIGTYTFYGCTNLQTVVLGNDITNIADYAFYGCKNLTNLTLPVSTTFTSSSTIFSGCTNLTNITLTKGTGVMTKYTSSTYQYTPWYIQKNNVRTVIIEEGVTNVGEYAFSNCTGLQNVIIKNDSIKIESSAFLKCTGLTSITLPASFSMNYSFANCINLTNVTLTKGTGTMTNLTSSDYKTTPWYISRSNMNTATIEYGVENIGNYMFYNCTGLKNVVYNDVIYTSLSELTAALEADGVTIGTDAFTNTGLLK